MIERVEWTGGDADRDELRSCIAELEPGVAKLLAHGMRPLDIITALSHLSVAVRDIYGDRRQSRH